MNTYNFLIHAETFFDTMKKALLFTKDEQPFDRIAFRQSGNNLLVEALNGYQFYRNTLELSSIALPNDVTMTVHINDIAPAVKATPKRLASLVELVFTEIPPESDFERSRPERKYSCHISLSIASFTIPAATVDWVNSDGFVQNMSTDTITRNAISETQKSIDASLTEKQKRTIAVSTNVLEMPRKIWGKDAAVYMSFSPDRQMLKFYTNDANDNQFIIAMGMRSQETYDD